MIHHDVPWADYHAWDEMNGSTLAHIFDSPRQLKHAIGNGFIPKADVHVGSALHSIVEYLPLDKFEAFYAVEPDFSKSPHNEDAKGYPSMSAKTKWVKERKVEFRENETREVLTHKEYLRIVRMLKSIQSNHQAMEIIMNTPRVSRELNVTGDVFGIPMRGRVDGVDGNFQWNLKSTRSITQKRFGYTARDLHYLFKDAIHMLLLRLNDVEITEFSYIVVKDAVPRDDGKYNECPDCCVVPVPLVALQNQFNVIEDKLALYKKCVADDHWPGVGDYDFFIPESYMSEQTLVD